MSAPRLTPKMREMLKRIADASDRNGSLMQLAVVAAGGGERTKLRRIVDAGWAEICEHQLPRGPVPGVRVTAAGRQVLVERAP